LARENGHSTRTRRSRQAGHILLGSHGGSETQIGTPPPMPATQSQAAFIWPPPVGSQAALYGEQRHSDPQPTVWYPSTDGPAGTVNLSGPPPQLSRGINGSAATPSLPYPLAARPLQTEHQSSANGTPVTSPVHGNGSGPSTYVRRGPGLFSLPNTNITVGRTSRSTTAHRGPVPPQTDSPPGPSPYFLGLGAGRRSGSAQATFSTPSPLSMQNVSANDSGNAVRQWSQSYVNGNPSPAPSPSMSAAGFASNGPTLSPGNVTSFLAGWRIDSSQNLAAEPVGRSASNSRTDLRALEESLQNALGAAPARGRDRQRGRDFPIMREMPSSETPMSTSTSTTPNGPVWLPSPGPRDDGSGANGGTSSGRRARS